MKHFKIIAISTMLFGTAQAVDINPGGFGEAIILPYYTVNNSLNTLLTISNSTDQVKAVKVHFREGKAGKAVLTFNMFLAPQDVWAGGLVPVVSTIPGHVGEDSSMLLFSDQSCTPYLSSTQEFLPFEIDAESDDTNLQRAREGYIEVLEMGELDPTIGIGISATFDEDGRPVNCGELEDAYSFGGIWDETGGDFTEQLLPTNGGLSATAGIIDVAEGTLYSYDGVAFSNFYPAGSIFHSTPGDTSEPSLAQADTSSLVLTNGEYVSAVWEYGYQAISALLMKNQVEGFYSTDLSLAAKTEMVLSFPTKRFYPDDASPFAEIELTQDAGCAAFDARMYNRESELLSCISAEECIDPLLPVPEIVVLQVCNSINVLQVGLAEVNQVQGILGSNAYTHIAGENGESGKLHINFNQTITTPASESYAGAPVIALAFEKYTNANASPGLLAQYGGIYQPKYKTEISSN